MANSGQSGITRNGREEMHIKFLWRSIAANCKTIKNMSLPEQVVTKDCSWKWSKIEPSGVLYLQRC
jgi:hypothetical protein